MPVEHQQMVSAPGNAFSDEDMAALEAAVRHLEHPSLAARLSSVVGTPIEMALELLPRSWYQRLHASAESVVSSVFIAAVANMGHSARVGPRETLHKVLGMVTGAAGGLFGLPGLAVELPVSTAIMLRAIAEIARDEGEDVRDPEVRMACVQVFALGGRAHSDDAAETGYYSVRLALASSVSAALDQVTRHGVAAHGTPAAVAFVRSVASRFGIRLSQKAAAQMVPLLGAAGAAAVNAIFISHFQEMARSHFTVRRLERRYGEDPVRAHYERFAESA